jgi:hypothetical protein
MAVTCSTTAGVVAAAVFAAAVSAAAPAAASDDVGMKVNPDDELPPGPAEVTGAAAEARAGEATNKTASVAAVQLLLEIALLIPTVVVAVVKRPQLGAELAAETGISISPTGRACKPQV